MNGNKFHVCMKQDRNSEKLICCIQVLSDFRQPFKVRLCPISRH